MKNPLRKRFIRNLKSEFGKYLVIFIFMGFTVAFISGFLVAGESMLEAYEEAFDQYLIEDGNFTTSGELDSDTIHTIEKENKILLYENYYLDLETDRVTIRVYKNRDDINRASILSGTLPVNSEDTYEIAIDRLFAENNGITIGDSIKLSAMNLTVCGLIALSDYSSLFESNNDMVFNASDFSVAVVTDVIFYELAKSADIQYCYSWLYTNDQNPGSRLNLKDSERVERSEDLMKNLMYQVHLKNFIPELDNQSIHFAGDDLGKDKNLMIILLYIIIVIMAFIFAITTSNTIEKEAAVIGTLRASGYTRTELLFHYMALPVTVLLSAAIVGNVLGYTYFKDRMADLYYGSYSLPTYETRFNAEAFILTTLVPCAIMILINLIILLWKLSLSPLKFLRRDLKRVKNRKAVKLPAFRFMTRFRLRIIGQNLTVYLMLTIGIIFANVLLMFGLVMNPLMKHYTKEVSENSLCDYQYILNTAVPVDNDNAESYAVTALMYTKGNRADEIMIYGISEDSDYFSLSEDTKDGKIYASDGLFKKYGINAGGEITLEEEYKENGNYTFKVEDSVYFPSSLALFMDIDTFCEVFDKEEGYYNGYFSNEKLGELDERLVARMITKEDLSSASRQLEDSMGAIFPLVAAFSIIMYALLLYLLTKLVIEKNSRMISLVKILGYNNDEIRGLYIRSSTIVTVMAVFVSLPIAYLFMKKIYRILIQSFSGWMTFYVAPWLFPVMIVSGIAAYLLISLIYVKKIKNVPMGEALKNAE